MSARVNMRYESFMGCPSRLNGHLRRGCRLRSLRLRERLQATQHAAKQRVPGERDGNRLRTSICTCRRVESARSSHSTASGTAGRAAEASAASPPAPRRAPRLPTISAEPPAPPQSELSCRFATQRSSLGWQAGVDPPTAAAARQGDAAPHRSRKRLCCRPRRRQQQVWAADGRCALQAPGPGPQARQPPPARRAALTAGCGHSANPSVRRGLRLPKGASRGESTGNYSSQRASFSL
jgi:hypothetical protein